MIRTSNVILPDVFLAGTPKSGTTFLFDLLAQHPGVNPSNPKEPFFYVDDSCPFNQKFSLIAKQDYRSFYDNSLPGLHIDGTSQTVYQNKVLNEISVAEVKPKIIVVLRDPARRILSSFGYTKNNLGAVKSSIEFKDYVSFLLKGDKQAIKEASRDDKAFYSLSHELDFSNYWKYLTKWEKGASRQNLKVVIFEDLMENTSNVLNEVLNFLELEVSGFSPLTNQKNETVDIRNKRLHYFLYKAFGAVGYRLPFKKQLKVMYTKLQHGKKSAKDHDEPLNSLKEYFAPLNEQLGKSFNLNLEKW